MSNERLTNGQNELGPKEQEKLSESGKDRLAELNEQLEKRAESTKESDSEKLKDTAEKLAEKDKKAEKAPVSPAEKRKEVAPKHRKKLGEAEFKKRMSDVQSQLSPTSRTFSKVIHNKAVEKTSDAVGATVARPNALLSGAVASFILTLVVFLVAKYFGYPLSGTESIAAFILGWVLGLLFDYFRVLITGKRA